ncbi:MAG: DUF4886 domain-containing protein [Kiritimatiellae bacterium]|jgi:hypothetical protein|nr:DUF4886 domain-containing protein [Kiritimatiellia bacterium]
MGFGCLHRCGVYFYNIVLILFMGLVSWSAETVDVAQPSEKLREAPLNDYCNHIHYVNDSGKLTYSSVVAGRCASPYIRVNRDSKHVIRHIQSLGQLKYPIIAFYDKDVRFTHGVLPEKKGIHYTNVVVDASVYKDDDVYYRFNSYTVYENSVAGVGLKDFVVPEDMEIARRLFDRVDAMQGPNASLWRQIKNPPLPQLDKTKDVLDVLVMGSSWSVDQASLIRDVALASGIHLNVGSAYYSGVPYVNLNKFWAENTPTHSYQFWDSDGNPVVKTTPTLKEIVESREWDVIVIGNSAANSPRWSTYQPHMRQWIRTIKMHATNPNMVLATYMGWTPSPNGKYLKAYGYDTVEAMMSAQIQTIQKAVFESGIDLLIPTGTAFHSLRTTSVNNDEYLTRDALHLDLGVGRYTAALSFFGTILTPVFGEGVAGNSYRSPNQKTAPNYVPVTDITAPIVQRCVQSAIADRFYLYDMSEL